VIEELTSSDPLLKIIWHVFHRPRQVYIAAIIMNIILHAMGLYYSFVFGEKQILPIWEPSQIIQGLSVGLLASPSVWVFSLWQSFLLVAIIENLHSKKLIAKKISVLISNRRQTASFMAIIIKEVTQKYWSVIALLTGIIGTYIFFDIIVPNEIIAQGGRPAVFYATPALKFIYAIYFFPHIYLIALTVFRAIAAISAIGKFFSQSASVVKISMFDPDQCGGFGVIGQFSQSLGLLAVITGWVSATSTLHPVIMGGQANITIITIVSIFYIILVPICVIGPIWPTHIAMKAHRDALIQTLSKKADIIVNKILSDKIKNIDPSENLLNIWNELETAHNFLLRNMPIWPLSWLSARSFSVAAAIPVFINLLTIGLSFFGSKPTQ